MGADLLLAYIPVPGPDVDLEARIQNLDVESMAAVLESRTGLNPDDWTDPELSDGGEEIMTWQDDVRAYLKTAVEQTLGTPDARDVAVLTIAGADYLFTGGMSWGDSPTEAWDYVIALAESGICDP